MSDLQTTYYILGIIFMSIMLLIGLVVVISVLVIRKKIAAIHDRIEEKLSMITTIGGLAEKGGAVLGALKKASRQSK